MQFVQLPQIKNMVVSTAREYDSIMLLKRNAYNIEESEFEFSREFAPSPAVSFFIKAADCGRPLICCLAEGESRAVNTCLTSVT